jgi:hypothetical protein
LYAAKAVLQKLQKPWNKPVIVWMLATALSLIIAAPPPTFSQEIEPFRYWTNGVGIADRWVIGNMQEVDITEIKKRWDEIGESLETTKNPFAGTYFQSGDSGYYLRWSPEKGFVYVYYHEYFVLDASYGDVSVSDLGLLFKVKREMRYTSHGMKLSTPPAWIPVVDGRYLIRASDIRTFGDSYGGFGAFNGFPRKWNCDCSAFAERKDKNVDYPQAVSFVAPVEYLKFIRKPISGNIIAVGKKYLAKHPVPFNPEDTEAKASLTQVTLNRGRRDGVASGLLFLIGTDQDATHQVLRVTHVGLSESRGVVIRMRDKNGREVYEDGWNDKTDKPVFKLYEPVRKGTVIATRSTSFFD